MQNPFAKAAQLKKGTQSNISNPPNYTEQVIPTLIPTQNVIPPYPPTISTQFMTPNSNTVLPPPPTISDLQNIQSNSFVGDNSGNQNAPQLYQNGITLPTGLKTLQFEHHPRVMIPQQLPPEPKPVEDMSDGKRIKQYEYKTQSNQEANQRVDPKSIPRPSLVVENIEYHTMDQILPPLSTVPFTAIDNGCCNPRFIRSSLYKVPTTKSQLTASGLPFNIVVHPLAEITEDEGGSIPIVDFDFIGNVRCTECLAYVNPFFQFLEEGNKMQCNICKTIMPVPANYYSSLDTFGKRTDLESHPELSHGSIDLLVNDQFKIRPVQKPIYVFAINTSYVSFSNGWFNYIIDFLKECVNLLVQIDNSNIVILTFSDVVNYYYIKDEKTHIFSACDLDSGFSPLPFDLLKIPISRMKDIYTILDLIKQTTEQSQSPNNCFGSCVQSIADLLSIDGGRIFLFDGSTCNVGAGSNTLKTDPCSIYGKEDEKQYYTPEPNNFYGIKGAEFNNLDIRCDIFAFGSDNYLRLSEIGELSVKTGGHLYYYPTPSISAFVQFHSDLYTAFSAPHVFEPILKLRVSQGLKVLHSGFLGLPGAENIVDQLDMGGVDFSQSWNFDIDYTAAQKENDFVYMQSALLYTAINEKRYIRVHNLRLHTSSTINDIFSNCDIECIVNALYKKCVLKLNEKTLYDARYYPFDKAVDILAAYRKNCASTTPDGQLVLPDCLKTLPLYTMCMMKSPLLRMNSTGQISYKDIAMRADNRSYHSYQILSFNVHTSVLYLYPYLFDLSSPLWGDLDEDGILILPNLLWPSSQSLELNKYYLLFNGIDIYIFVNHNIDPSIYLQLSNVNTLPEFLNTQLYINDNPLSQKLFNIIEYLKNPFEQNIEVTLLSNESLNSNLFYTCLVEDKQGITPSYTDFICTLHQRIKQKL